MPSLRHLLPRHADRRVDSEGKLSPKSPKSPKSPRSPKTPRSSFSRTEQNYDYLNQCAGCSNIEILIRKNLELRKNDTERVPNAILHNSFEELEQCAKKCEICRVFRQSLVLEEVTYERVKELQKSQGTVVVNWQEEITNNGNRKLFLKVEIKGQSRRAGVVNCSAQNDVGHLELQSDSLHPVVIEQARAWLDNCRRNHVGQCDNLKWSSETPRFLIEILSPDTIKLSENQKAEYAALSYCWGNMDDLSETKQKEIEQGKTYLANLDGRRKAFPVSDLPTTVRDALRIIHRMGIRFAWVDTLCIIQDKPDDVATMHKVYSNALFTLCSCATTFATEHLLEARPAWAYRTEPCRLGGQWLTTTDMSLTELRLRSPLADRAWTLQEERLSPRMLYISSSRIHWSCAVGHEMELRPTYEEKITSTPRPVYATSDHSDEMPRPQQFLLACYEGKKDLHAYWLDITKSYALRSMGKISDRLTALSGLAAKYLSASNLDEYLAGLWANDLAEGLAWRVERVIEQDDNNLSASWPSWSWAALPLQTAIRMNLNSKRAPSFEWIGVAGTLTAGASSGIEDAIKRGEQVKEICVTGQMRRLWTSSSRSVHWSNFSTIVDGDERFSFTESPEQNMHSLEPNSGRILVYEDRKKEIIGQLDFRQNVIRTELNQVELWAFELGASTMLLLEHCGAESWRRVGVAWDVREDYFARANKRTVIIR